MSTGTVLTHRAAVDDSSDTTDKMAPKAPVTAAAGTSGRDAAAVTTPDDTGAGGGGAADVFYPGTPFTSWREFFTMPASGPRGVTRAARAEMCCYIAVCVTMTYVFISRIFHIGRHLGDVVGEGNYWLDLEAPRFAARWLAPGYDVSDHQWRRFEQHFGLLTLGCLAYVGASQLARRALGVSRQASLALYAALNTGVAVYLHGWGAVPLLTVLALHYALTVHVARRLPRWLFLSLMWVALTLLLLGNEWNHGFEAEFHQHLPALAALFKPAVLKWSSVFPMHMLRLVAFSVDYLEAVDKGDARRAEVSQRHRTACIQCSAIAAKNNASGQLLASEILPLCYKARTDTPRHADEYSLVNYVAYVLTCRSTSAARSRRSTPSSRTCTRRSA